MKILIKSALIVDSGSPLNGKKRDILIENGKIALIATSIIEPISQRASSSQKQKK